MLVLGYCLKENVLLGYTKRKAQCRSRNVLVTQLVVSRILIHYLIHKTFAKKKASQFDGHVERRRLCPLPCHGYFLSGYIFARDQAEVLQECAHYLFRVSYRYINISIH